MPMTLVEYRWNRIKTTGLHASWVKLIPFLLFCIFHGKQQGFIHSIPAHNLFARVILPLNLNILYSYHIPADLKDLILPGMRVEVQFGRSKLYAGIVSEVYHELEIPTKYKTILSVLDDEPIVTVMQLKTWHWIAEYYCCSLGDVMAAALPAAFKLDSESKIILIRLWPGLSELNDQEYLVAEALAVRNVITIDQVQKYSIENRSKSNRSARSQRCDPNGRRTQSRLTG